MPKVRFVVAVAAVALVAVSGCGAGPSTGVVSARAQAFADALARKDGAAACGLLVPDAVSSVEAGGGECDKDILTLGLPHGAATGAVVWGGQARVQIDGKAVFLTQWDDTWRIIAAGCSPRSGRPFDCDVEA